MSQIWGSLLAILLFGCYSPPPQTPEPLFELPGTFSQTGEQQLEDKWWQTFNDPQLNKLVEAGLRHNFSLQAAFYRLKQAEATCRKTSSKLQPSISTANSFTTSRSRINEKTSSGQSLSLALAASYEIDLWGRISSLAEAAELDMLESEMALQTAAITLSSQIASTWYQLSEQRLQLKLLQQQYQTTSKTLQIIRLKFRTGKVGIEDIFQQEQLLENNRAAQAKLGIDLTQSYHKLNILLGEPPDSMKYIPDSSSIPQLSPLPATGIPLELLQKRPDVRAAYYAVKAANSRLAAAIAAQYPTFSISANLATTGLSTADLFKNWQSNLAGNILAPILNGGNLKADVIRREAQAQETLKTYNQVMLEALGEVENALKREARLQKYLQHIDRQLELAAQSMKQIKNRYINGNTNYQRVLSAMVSRQNLEQSQLKARQSLVNNRIELCRSLAGGWKMSTGIDNNE